MRETALETDAAFAALFAGRSAGDRVRMACDMFDAAKKLMAADIRSTCPEISAAELRVQMFARLYFGDFDAETMARISAALR